MSSRPAWRLVVDGALDGAENMARDRAILAAHEAGEVPATLRLYRWRRPTVTLGRFQRLDAIDPHACRAHGVTVVRRPTGGRGVLHDDELTYSIIAGTGDGLPRGVTASYRVLCTGLVEAFRLLGVPAELTARDHGERSSACYLHASAADVSVGLRKLAGSAQVWHGDSVLQHGSFVLRRDVEREASVFALDPAQRDRLAGETSTLEELLGEAPDVQRVAQAVVDGVARGLDVELVDGELTPAELARAARLAPDALVHTQLGAR